MVYINKVESWKNTITWNFFIISIIQISSIGSHTFKRIRRRNDTKLKNNFETLDQSDSVFKQVETGIGKNIGQLNLHVVDGECSQLEC